MSTTYHVGDGPLVSTAVGLCDGGVGRFLAFLRPFETGMAQSVVGWARMSTC